MSTEFEKMIAGELYNAEVPELQDMRTRAAQLCHQLDQLSPTEGEARLALLKELLGKTGEHLTINHGFKCDYGSNITVGEHFYANYNLVVLDCAPVVFGDNVFIAPNCGFYTAGHPLDAPTRNSGLEFARPITVGDNVWIGGNVTVLPGVTIGSGAVIGAGSVVVHDIPSNVVAVGNPCKVVRVIENLSETPAP
ncbi:MAG: sugar O-acetyltransferase [Clostridiales bacterium]|uniref:sugar O-acetyltransferase n=1 Tax=Flavonifractor porci TaxID=3133422 RepID=UPI00309A757C|nr:sugar O-acetyltransferase [Clostridiales bacterium]